MTIAIYARVSTGLQAMEGTSLDGQIELCQKKIHELGLAGKIEVYKEAGVSGEDIDRPEMNRLRENIQKRNITHIVCTHPDRLSRNLVDKLLVCKEFDQNDVELLFVDTEYKDTPEGQLFFNMQSAIAQYELSMIKKRTTRGRIKAVESNNKIMPMRVPPYGYDYKDGQLLINEDEAKYVNLIYDWYIFDKLTIREIGNRLYKLGARPKRSNTWNQTSISRILSSEIYIGRYYYNRRQRKRVQGEKTATGNKKFIYSIRDQADWICVRVPAIIDEATFELAEKQRNQNKTYSGGNRKYNFLLRSMIKCAKCGRTWQSTTYSGRMDKKTGERKKYLNYRCPNQFPRKYGSNVERCTSKNMKTEYLDNYVWDLIVNILRDPQSLVKRIEEQIQTDETPYGKYIDSIKNAMDKKKKEKEKVKIMFRRDVISEEEMINDIKEIDKEVERYKQELDVYETLEVKRRQKEKGKEQVQNLISTAKGILDNLRDPYQVPFEERKKIVDLLVEKVIIDSDEETGKYEVTCVGPLDDLLGIKSGIGLSTHRQEI
jgi:site-specific DNA recombinase